MIWLTLAVICYMLAICVGMVLLLRIRDDDQK